MAFVNAWAGVSYRWSEQIRLWLRGVYREDRYIDEVLSDGTWQDREDDRFEVNARIHYRTLSGRWEAYVQASREIVESTLPEYEYEDTRLTLGGQVAY